MFVSPGIKTQIVISHVLGFKVTSGKMYGNSRVPIVCLSKFFVLSLSIAIRSRFVTIFEAVGAEIRKMLVRQN